MEPPMSLPRNSLIRVLTVVQNSAEFANQDIMTFCGFLDNAEVAEHLHRCFDRLSEGNKGRAFAALQAEHDALAKAA